MRNTLCLIVLALAGGNAAADWVVVSETPAATVYVESGSVQRSGDRATLSELTNYRSVQEAGRSYQSVRRAYQFDCQEGALRTLSITHYREKMAQGEPVLVVDEPTTWLLFTPGSVGEILWRIACRRRSDS